MIDTNPTALSDLFKCPYRYYLLRVLKVPHPITPAMALGELLHRVLETKTRQDEDELIFRLEMMWGEYADILGEDKSLAISLLRNYSKSRFNIDAMDAEKSCSFFLDNEIRINCRLDRVYRDNGTIHIVDWKTGFAPLTYKRLEQHPQTQCYLLAGLKEWPDFQVKLSYYYLKDDYTVTFQYDPDNAKHFVRKTRRKLSEEFVRKESRQCEFCPVRGYCSPNFSFAPQRRQERYSQQIQVASLF